MIERRPNTMSIIIRMQKRSSERGIQVEKRIAVYRQKISKERNFFPVG